MITFIKQTLSGDTGPSAKRFWLSIFSAVWIYLVILDAHTGKHPDQFFSEKCFWLVVFFVVLVFLEKFIPVIMAAVMKKYGIPDAPTIINVKEAEIKP